MKNIFLRYICRMLIVCMGAFPFSTYAGMVGTDQVVAAVQTQGTRDKVRDFIGRSEVSSQLQNLGISSTAAQERVSAMTDAEVASLVGQIDSLPAGGISGWAIATSLLVIGLIWYYWVK
ncbi:MAG: PA2779 family protein [Pseudomonadota bacterium]